MKNIAKSIFLIDKCQIALQVYDKGAITRKQLSEIIQIDFDSGELKSELWEKSIHANDVCILLMQLYDKQLITKEILLKILFDIEVEESKENSTGTLSLSEAVQDNLKLCKIKNDKKAEVTISETTIRSLLDIIEEAKKTIDFSEYMKPMSNGEMSLRQFEIEKRKRGTIVVSSPYNSVKFRINMEVRPHSQESYGYRLEDLPEEESFSSSPGIVVEKNESIKHES